MWKDNPFPQSCQRKHQVGGANTGDRYPTFPQPLHHTRKPHPHLRLMRSIVLTLQGRAVVLSIYSSMTYFTLVVKSNNQLTTPFYVVVCYAKKASLIEQDMRRDIKMNQERNLGQWPASSLLPHFLLKLALLTPRDSSKQPSFLSSIFSPSNTTTLQSSSALPPTPASSLLPIPQLHYVLCSPARLHSHTCPALVPWRTNTSCSESNKPHWPRHTFHPTQTLLSLLYLSLSFSISLYVSSSTSNFKQVSLKGASVSRLDFLSS